MTALGLGTLLTTLQVAGSHQQRADQTSCQAYEHSHLPGVVAAPAWQRLRPLGDTCSATMPSPAEGVWLRISRVRQPLPSNMVTLSQGRELTCDQGNAGTPATLLHPTS